MADYAIASPPCDLGAWTQNRENNPMQSRMGSRIAALVLRCASG
jgi:hypothetical protein